MIFTGSLPKQKSLAQQSWEEDNLPSIDIISVYLSQARELQTDLQHLHRIYPRFDMGKSLLHADMLVNDLEDMLVGLED